MRHRMWFVSLARGQHDVLGNLPSPSCPRRSKRICGGLKGSGHAAIYFKMPLRQQCPECRVDIEKDSIESSAKKNGLKVKRFNPFVLIFLNTTDKQSLTN
jgi:hypothetical protein